MQVWRRSLDKREELTREDRFVLLVQDRELVSDDAVCNRVFARLLLDNFGRHADHVADEDGSDESQAVDSIELRTLRAAVRLPTAAGRIEVTYTQSTADSRSQRVPRATSTRRFEREASSRRWYSAYYVDISRSVTGLSKPS